MTRTTRWMDGFIDSIEWIAAFFIGIVAFDVFVSVLLRYFFGYTIPDAYDFGQLLLAIAWIGDLAAVLLIAVRTYRLIFHPELIKPVNEASKSGE